MTPAAAAREGRRVRSGPVRSGQGAGVEAGTAAGTVSLPAPSGRNRSPPRGFPVFRNRRALRERREPATPLSAQIHENPGARGFEFSVAPCRSVLARGGYGTDWSVRYRVRQHPPGPSRRSTLGKGNASMTGDFTP